MTEVSVCPACISAPSYEGRDHMECAIFSCVRAELMRGSASAFPPCPFTMHTPSDHDADRQIATTDCTKASVPVLSVPGKPACSSLAEIATVGATTNSSPVICSSRNARVTTESIMMVSVSKGRCGPCCSVAPSGNTATVCAVSSSAKSVVLQSAQWRGMSFMRSILRAWVTWDSCY